MATQRTHPGETLSSVTMGDLYAAVKDSAPPNTSSLAFRCGADYGQMQGFWITNGGKASSIRVGAGWAQVTKHNVSSSGDTTLYTTLYRIPAAELTPTGSGIFFIYLPATETTVFASGTALIVADATVTPELALDTSVPSQYCPIVAVINVVAASATAYTVSVLWHCGGCTFMTSRYRKT